jgi:hypothetical protein
MVGPNGLAALDPMLSLFEYTSVIGRAAVVLASGNATSSLFCAPIVDASVLLQPLRLVANFTGAIAGSILLDRRALGSDTVLSVRLLAASQVSRLSWMVSDDCSASAYSTPTMACQDLACGLCGPLDGQLFCSAGDLSSKHGALKFSASLSENIFIDSYLPLSGPWGVLGRYVVLSDGPSIVACASITLSAAPAGGTGNRLC